MASMTEIENWEAAWTEYVNALENADADWSGENFVIDYARAARRVKDAVRGLRAIDAEFCDSLGIKL